MHKVFYASGFLYYAPTQQILLQQSNDTAPYWILFGGENDNLSQPEVVFQQLIRENLGVKLAPADIHEVYDYFHKDLNRNHFIVYGEITTPIEKIKPKKGLTVGWFNFKQVTKLPLSEQTRQDIMVSQRVINAVARSREIPEVPTDTEDLVDKS